MSELASMAANKSTTNNVTNITSTSTSSSPAPQANSPVLSSASSLVSPDSSATNPISSPEAQTPQNTPQTNSPLTTAIIADETEDNNSASTTPTNQTSNALVDASGTISASLDNNNILKSLTDDDAKCDSPLIDTKSSGSVHEKASMFERKLSEEQSSTQAGAPAQHHHPNPLSLLNNSTLNLTPATVARLESIYGKKTEEIYGRTTSASTTSLMERVVVETGQFFFFMPLSFLIICVNTYLSFKWAVLLVSLCIVNHKNAICIPSNVDFFQVVGKAQKIKCKMINSFTSMTK